MMVPNFLYSNIYYILTLLSLLLLLLLLLIFSYGYFFLIGRQCYQANYFSTFQT